MTETRDETTAPQTGAKDGGDAERIAKVLARAGLCSRREAEEWVTAGRVAVNGRVLESPAFTVTPKDVVTVDGQPLPVKERTRLWLFHKPRGLVTTNQDPEGRPTVFSVLPEDMPRVVTVGRLDINTEGLLLLTNDGGVARVLELPSTGWLRRYRVRAFGQVEESALKELAQGISLDGVDYGPIEAVIERVQGSNIWLVLGLREGKNREVKRVLAALGLTVNRLIRVSFGPFQLADLEEGEIREIRGRVLRDQLGPRLVAEAGADFEAPVVHHMQGDVEADEGRKRKIRPFDRDGEPRSGDRGDRPRGRAPRTHMEFVGTGEKRGRDRGDRGEGAPRPRSEGHRSRPEGGPGRGPKWASEGQRDRSEGRGGKPRSEGFRDRPNGGRAEGFRDRPNGGRAEGFRDRPSGGRAEGFRDRPNGGRAEGFRDRPVKDRGEGHRDRPRDGDERGGRWSRDRSERDFSPRTESSRGEVRPPRGDFASEGFRGRSGGEGGKWRSEGFRGRGGEAAGEGGGRAQGFRDRPEGAGPKGGRAEGFGPRGPRGMSPGGRKDGFDAGPKEPRGERPFGDKRPPRGKGPGFGKGPGGGKGPGFGKGPGGGRGPGGGKGPGGKGRGPRR